MERKKLIGYVGSKDLSSVREQDAAMFDVINIAFGRVEDAHVLYTPPAGFEQSLQRIREANALCKIVLSVGGWTAGGFSEAAATKEGRELFARTAAELAERYRLDGIDIDWEYPCIDAAGIAADPADKVNFTELLYACRRALDSVRDGYKMLTIAAGAGEYFIESTQMAQVQSCLDYVQLMTYDMRGSSRHITGHHTNVYYDRNDESPSCVEHAVSCFREAGVPAEKIVIGAAYYSRLWKGVTNAGNGLHQSAKTIGDYGPGYGTLVEQYINKNGYKRFFDETAQAPYLFNGDEFLSYDDEVSCRAKADYVNKEGLLGVMFWEYGLDTTYTLTPALRSALDASAQNR